MIEQHGTCAIIRIDYLLLELFNFLPFHIMHLFRLIILLLHARVLVLRRQLINLCIESWCLNMPWLDVGPRVFIVIAAIRLLENWMIFLINNHFQTFISGKSLEVCGLELRLLLYLMIISVSIKIESKIILVLERLMLLMHIF